MEYRNYFLRCIESDKAELLALGVLLQVLQESEGRHCATAGDFVEIGYVYRPTGETVLVDGIETAVTEPVRDENGNLYWHANLRTTINLRERAGAMAVSNPELAAALSQLGKYFVTDELGQPRAPNNPAVVWGGLAPPRSFLPSIAQPPLMRACLGYSFGP